MRNLIVAVILLAGVLAQADPLKGYDFKLDSVSTATVTNSYTATSVTGKALAVSVVCSTNLSLRLQTVKGVGSSLSSAKTLIASTNTLGAFQWNIGSTVYLQNDQIILQAWSAGRTNIPVKVKLIVDQDN